MAPTKALPWVETPLPITFGLTYLGYRVIESERGQPIRVELRFGEEDADHVLHPTQIIDIGTEYGGYHEEAIFLTFTSRKPA